MKLVIKEALVWKVGDSSVITIPSDYIKNGQMQVGKEYNVWIEVKQ